MLYPTIVLTFASIVLAGMLMFLVPIFTKIFSQLNGDLPTLTPKVAGGGRRRHHPRARDHRFHLG